MKTISLEGPDFSGKSTLGTALLMKLRDKGLTIERMELPSRMVTGIFTELLRNSKDKIDPKVFAMIYSADHLHHYLSTQSMNDIDVMLLERSVVSLFVYQSIVLGVDPEWIKELNKYNQTVPDLTVIVKVPEEELIRRSKIRVGLNDAFEKEDFLRKVVKAYYNLPEWLIKKYNVKYIEWEGMEKTTETLLKMVEGLS
ncbi:MAG: hypothetical protein GOV01_03065 [Candidatus Altiarchaeota archaeon]|nr:hypothetical protein [Candidatus Altiarchaeota archaeon]